MRHTLLVLLLALSVAHSTQASGLGRLLFTPEQRVQLERERARNATPEDGYSPSLTINGIVQKKGGARTVWINGVAQSVGNSDERSPDSLAVSVPGQSLPIKVKVGQKILLGQPAQTKPPASVQKEKQPADDD